MSVPFLSVQHPSKPVQCPPALPLFPAAPCCPGCSASPTLCKASSPVQVESPSCASPAMAHLGQSLQAIVEEEKVLAVFSQWMKRVARRERQKRFVSKPMIQLKPLLGNTAGTTSICVTWVRNFQEPFILGFFFLVTPSFSQWCRRLNLKPVSKEKTNPTSPNYYLTLYVHMYMCIIYLRQARLCPCRLQLFIFFCLNTWLICQWIIALLCSSWKK